MREGRGLKHLTLYRRVALNWQGLPMQVCRSHTVLAVREKVKWEKIQGGIVLHTENLKPSVDCIVALKLK